MDKNNWTQLMGALGFSASEKEFNIIVKYYNEKHRKYHNLTHIHDCISKCELNEETKSNHVLHFAFWYHDIIYSPFKKNNELMSADLAEKFLDTQSANKEMKNRVRNLIMATLHNSKPKTNEEAYMMDIDVSILGANKAVYEKYTADIRKEYHLVPWFLYKRKRIEILEMFLVKERIYFTDYFKFNFEASARTNIHNEIKQLKNMT